jgi:hypothetical protein
LSTFLASVLKPCAKKVERKEKTMPTSVRYLVGSPELEGLPEKAMEKANTSALVIDSASCDQKLMELSDRSAPELASTSAGGSASSSAERQACAGGRRRALSRERSHAPWPGSSACAGLGGPARSRQPGT